MLKKLLVVSLFLPLVSECVTPAYVSSPASVEVVKKNIEDLKKEINGLEVVRAQEVYDYFSKQKKEVTDKNLLEIYYVVISYLRVQSNLVPEKELKENLISLLNRLKWLYSDHDKEIFTDKITNLTRLLKQDFFIHLDHKKMADCLDQAHRLKDIIEYSNIRNEIGPEDGSDYFSSDYFLQDEINQAEQIFSQTTELEKVAQGFSDNVEALSKDQIIANITQANSFINKLRLATITVNDKKVEISRNLRKHLNNLASASIQKLVEKRNQLEK